jgi:hypothetical protein
MEIIVAHAIIADNENPRMLFDLNISLEENNIKTYNF